MKRRVCIQANRHQTPHGLVRTRQGRSLLPAPGTPVSNPWEPAQRYRKSYRSRSVTLPVFSCRLSIARPCALVASFVCPAVAKHPDQRCRSDRPRTVYPGTFGPELRRQPTRWGACTNQNSCPSRRAIGPTSRIEAASTSRVPPNLHAILDARL